MSRKMLQRRVLEPGVAPYAPAPYAVLRRTDVGFAAKCLLAAIADLTPNKDNRRLATLGFLGRQIGASRATVIRARAELSRLNIVEFDQRPGRRAAYKLLLTPADYQNGTARGSCADLPKGSQDETALLEKGSQDETATVSDCNGGGINLRPPLASRTLSTDLYHSPRGVPPLVWRELAIHLQTIYAEAWGPQAAPPGRWYDLMAQEVRRDNIDLVRGMDEVDMRAGRDMADRQKRPYGFRWVVLAAQQRQIDLADAQRAKDATGTRTGANRASVERAHAAAEDHQAGLREVGRRRQEHFDSLPEDCRQRYLDATRVRYPASTSSDYVVACAAAAAWADHERGQPAAGGTVDARTGRRERMK